MRKLQTWLTDQPKWLVTAGLFAFCVAPTFISYQPYLFTWDDSDYLLGSMRVSQAFWSGNVHGLRAMVGMHPPAMKWLGLPWGPLTSWDAAGKCFITLAAVISLLAASCLYLLLRIGVKPLFLVVAGVCVGASLGPYPHAGLRQSCALAHTGETHDCATGFMADSLVAWAALAATLFIPYEARTPSPLIRGAVLRGIGWGSILSLGVMTKLSFLYFIALIVPFLFFISLYRDRFRITLAKFFGIACSSAPAMLYLLRFGQSAFDTATANSFWKASSVGWMATFDYTPLPKFLGEIIRDSPGLLVSFVLTAGAFIYLLIKRRLAQSWPELLAFLIMSGFGIVVLASPNRDIRYLFPTIVGLPFLAAMLMSGNGHSAPRPSATLAAGLVFCALLAAGVPTRHRADSQVLVRSNAVLAQAARCNAKHITIATVSPTLNGNLMDLAMEVTDRDISVKVVSYLVGSITGVPIEEEFHTMLESNQVFFQRDALPLSENQRVTKYEQYLRQGGYVPVKVDDDVSVYSIQCTP